MTIFTLVSSSLSLYCWSSIPCVWSSVGSLLDLLLPWKLIQRGSQSILTIGNIADQDSYAFSLCELSAGRDGLLAL